MSKSPGFVVNKTAEIRRVASELVAQGKPPRPKVIKESLAAKEIQVSSAQVSMALTDTEFAYRRNGPQKPILASDFAQRLETLERAVVAMAALLNSKNSP